MGRLEGKVVVISGAARGQGRAHAVTMAREGASIVAFDMCEPLKFVLTPGATEEQLAETQQLVEEQDQQCLTAKADARDLGALNALADRAMTEFGRVDIVLVNHGLWHHAPNTWELDEEIWQQSIDVLLTGAWKVAKAFIPKILEGGHGGSIVFTSSVNAFTVQPGAGDYCAGKAGLSHLMRTLAWELGEHNIRVNAVCPGGIRTPMLMEGGTMERANEMHPEYMSTNRNRLPVEWQPPESISNAILYLVSDDGAYTTGQNISVDSGWSIY